MRPPTTPPARKPTCGTCAAHKTTFGSYASPSSAERTTITRCDITRHRVNSLMLACPLYDRHVIPIPPT